MKRLEAIFFRRPRILNVLHQLHLIDATSQTIESERDALAKHAANARVGVEIGSYQGLSSEVIAAAMPDGARLYCIDPWYEQPPGRRNPSYDMFDRQLRRGGVRERVTVLRGLSHEVIGDIPDEVDFIFVDGDHSWAGISTDWEIVKAKLRKGGIVCLHDTRNPDNEPWRELDSVRFYSEVIARDPSFRLVEQVYSLSVLVRES